MAVITNFSEAHAALRPLYNNARTKYDLTIMRRLMDFLGNPQDEVWVVHVAGTSGKTSTAYYIAALLQQAGYKVGLTVSPHVDEVNERVQVNLMPLSENQFCQELTEFLGLVQKSRLAPSYFEVMVAFAYWEFAKQNLDYAVVEVGLGGLLDGTNVVSRKDKVCVITDIGLDHIEILGDTIEEIAAQKAGIIQQENTVFLYDQGPKVTTVVRTICEKKQAALRIIPNTATAQYSLPLFQQRNLGLAVQVANFIVQRDHKAAITNGQINNAAKTHIPARMEQFQVEGKVFIVDGSHNAQKLGALAKSISAMYPMRNVAVLAAFVEGHDSRWQGGIDALMGMANSIIVTSFRAEQDVPKNSVDPQKVVTHVKEKGFENVTCEPDEKRALETLLKMSEPILVIAGSFYLLNNLRPLIINTI